MCRFIGFFATRQFRGFLLAGQELKSHSMGAPMGAGNNDVSMEGDRSAAYFWAAAKHNKQDGGRRREFFTASMLR